MILFPSKYLVKVSLKKKNHLVLYHSLFGGAMRVKQGVWDLIQRFKGEKDFPRSFSKKEISAYRNTILDLRKRKFLVRDGIDERALMKKENQKFGKSLAKGKCYITDLRLEMASYCNFRCLHCFAPKIYNWKKGKKMSFRTAKLAVDGFMDILRKTGEKEGGITFWGGEPLLNWQVIERIVEYVDDLTKDSSVKIVWGVITNGSLINNQILKFMKLHKIEVRVSLDGLEKENDQFRRFTNVEGTFKSIIKAMDGLSKFGIVFSVEMCLNDYNFNSAEKVLDYVYNNYKCKGFVIGPIFYQKTTSKFDHHSNQEKAKRIIQIYDYALKKGFSLNPADGLTLLNNAIVTRVPLQACIGLYCGLYVNPAGLVCSCHKITTPLGTIKQMGKIPQGKEYRYVAMRSTGRIKGCEGCEIEGFCAGGCAGIAQFYSGDIYDCSDPLFQSFYCDFRRHLFRGLLKHNMERRKFTK